MKKTIFNVYVVMESQEQCDVMKKVCIDNELPIWEDDYGFKMDLKINLFEYVESEFYITSCNRIGVTTRKCQTQATQSEFIQLLKEYKDEN